VEVVDLAVLDRCLRAMRKKRSSTFFRKKKCTPLPRQNPGYAYGAICCSL